MIAERTEAQSLYVQALCQRHHVTTPMLDHFCLQRFDRPYAKLDRYQCSELIDTMKEWAGVPAELQRAAGQIDLIGMEA